ncbi:hypothetical protein H4Q32_026326 [Labeo rohita]|uniref:Uncharacterized protein n=1 Tax=Labeo rohita TaxID=84645 RepID=A0ABQ8L6H8_LABRO|nr:hypothetical protein H4Q32_026326 [Labeo rohita]
MAVQHRDVVLAHMKETECQEKCAVSITEDHLSRRGVGFDHDAGTFVTCSDRVDPHCSHESERRPVTHCKAVPATAGSDGSCVQRECAMSPLVLSESSSSPGAGCHGTDVAEASSVRLSPDCSAPGSSGEGAPGRGPSFISSPVLAGPSMVLGPDFPPRRLSMGDSRQEGSPLASGRHDPSPSPGVVEVMGVASEGAHLIASGLSTEVVETILQSRAPSTRKLYALKWKLFTSWCGDRQQDPVNCPVGTVLEFLQDRFSTGLAHSTLKVYVAAIAAYHAPLGGTSVGKYPLVVRFLRGALRLRPPVQPRVPTWDLAVVLEALCGPPLSLSKSPRRVGDLQALFVAPSHLDFAPGMAKVFLYPRPGYVPKVPSLPPRPVVLQAFCSPPFRDSDQQKLNCMCPARALDTYVHRSALWRKSEQLFVCYGPLRRASLLLSKLLAAGSWMPSLSLMSLRAFPLPWGLRPILLEAFLPLRPFSLMSLCRTFATLWDGPRPLPLSARVPEGGTSQVTTVTLVPRRERDAASQALLPASLLAFRFS